ncbi:MAG: bifunctional UDP-sugar hydrolase/5'-nucleotidase [Pseudomonadota bacterium]
MRIRRMINRSTWNRPTLGHWLYVLTAIALAACQTLPPIESNSDTRRLTLLFTNDVESAYDPIPAFWMDDIETIGGIAQLASLIDQLRDTEPAVFLFDAGDIFTGALAKLTEGELAFELMATMGYDAMAIGNHEFEYGVEVLSWQKNRASFPVLGANMFYTTTDHPFAQAHTIIERDGFRIGVIGIMGQDARSAIIPSYIAPLDITDPVAAVQRSVDEIRDDVDLIVLLTHQGKTAPMQTDAGSDPRLQRDIDADIRLAGAVTGVDVLFGGHADAGTPEPVIHPQTGTFIMQTYGHGMHLGFLQLELDRDGRMVSHSGKLIPVDTKRLTPHPQVAAKLAEYRNRHPELREVVATVNRPMLRRYNEESTIGHFFADVFRSVSGADIGVVHSGSLRKDLPAGELLRVDVLDAYPFVDDVDVKRLTGSQIVELLEQSFSLERGLLQVSGLRIRYDLAQPVGERVLSVASEGRPLDLERQYTVAAPSFLAEGGDLYTTFSDVPLLSTHGKVSDVILDYCRSQSVIAVPDVGRQLPAHLVP